MMNVSRAACMIGLFVLSGDIVKSSGRIALASRDDCPCRCIHTSTHPQIHASPYLLCCLLHCLHFHLHTCHIPIQQKRTCARPNPCHPHESWTRTRRLAASAAVLVRIARRKSHPEPAHGPYGACSEPLGGWELSLAITSSTFRRATGLSPAAPVGRSGTSVQTMACMRGSQPRGGLPTSERTKTTEGIRDLHAHSAHPRRFNRSSASSLVEAPGSPSLCVTETVSRTRQTILRTAALLLGRFPRLPPPFPPGICLTSTRHFRPGLEASNLDHRARQ